MLNYISRFPVAVWPLILVILVLILSAVGAPVNHVLRFDHQAIFIGEYWRLVTAHFVHLGWAHALLNSGGLLLVAWMQPMGSVWRWWAFYLASSLFISIVMLINGEVSTYVGASGVLHGLSLIHISEPTRPY